MEITYADTSCDPYALMEKSKPMLIKYARKVATALPHETIYVSGRKADIAFSIVEAIKRNPEN